MKNIFSLKFIIVAILLCTFAKSISAQNPNPETPRVFLLDTRTLAGNKIKLSEGKADDDLKSAAAGLEKDAQKILKIQVASIVTKQANPPSGDKHDYMSQAPYFWKNPDTKDGFPYIRRDGERNPEIKQYPDHELLDRMANAVEKLSLAYYYTGREEYAAKASEILRMWFFDAATKMNPNLEYAQAIPGLNTGRGIGIIETRGLTGVVDAVGLLHDSKSWTKDDQTNLEAWFSKYLDWLTTSKNGREEDAAKNNHGTIYDEQVVSFALFVGKKDFARKVLETAKQKRIAKQVEPDGRQPLELERTKSWDYSTMNLAGLTELAKLGETVNVDLWNFQTADGRGIRGAIEFLYPVANGARKWADQQIDTLKPDRLYPSMRLAARIYRDENFTKMMQTIPKPAGADILSED